VKPLWIGTSGWHYKDWLGRFYPPKTPAERFLEIYSHTFGTVELNGVFYRLPKPEMVKGWYERSPKGFLFAYKASRYLTHMKKLADPESALRLMFQRADLLREKLGPILYQLPPFFPQNLQRLKTFFKALPRGYAHVMEFRHPTWFTPAVYELLEKARVSLCLYDMQGEPSPQVLTGPLAYVRFHGTQGKYAGSYPAVALRTWARKIDAWRRSRTAYAYFNNDAKGHAIQNALSLKEMV